jgi:hypothetical protein
MNWYKLAIDSSEWFSRELIKSTQNWTKPLPLSSIEMKLIQMYIETIKPDLNNLSINQAYKNTMIYFSTVSNDLNADPQELINITKLLIDSKLTQTFININVILLQCLSNKNMPIAFIEHIIKNPSQYYSIIIHYTMSNPNLLKSFLKEIWNNKDQYDPQIIIDILNHPNCPLDIIIDITNNKQNYTKNIVNVALSSPVYKSYILQTKSNLITPKILQQEIK